MCFVLLLIIATEAERSEARSHFFFDTYGVFWSLLSWLLIVVDIWCKNEKYPFSVIESIFEVTRPDPTRPGPTRPDPARPGPTRPDPTGTLFRGLFLENYAFYRKNLSVQKCLSTSEILCIKFWFEFIGWFLSYNAFCKSKFSIVFRLYLGI